jgi:hypothetical protein
MNGGTVHVQRPGKQRAMAAVTAALVIVALSAALRSIEASRPASNVGLPHVASSVRDPSVNAPVTCASGEGACWQRMRPDRPSMRPTTHNVEIQAATKYAAQTGR